MSIIEVDASKCPQDHVCPMIGVCPVCAISQDGFAAPKIDHEKCIACGSCVSMCPYQAFSAQ